MTSAQIIHDALEMDVRKRAMLAQVLLATLDEPDDVWLNAWLTEVEHRKASFELSGSKGYSLEQVLADCREMNLTYAV